MSGSGRGKGEKRAGDGQFFFFLAAGSSRHLAGWPGATHVVYGQHGIRHDAKRVTQPTMQ